MDAPQMSVSRAKASKPQNQTDWYEQLMFAPDEKNAVSRAHEDAEQACLIRESQLKKQFPTVRMTTACVQTVAAVTDSVLRAILAACHVHRGHTLPPVLTPTILTVAVKSVCTPRFKLPLPPKSKSQRTPTVRSRQSRTPHNPKKSKAETDKKKGTEAAGTTSKS